MPLNITTAQVIYAAETRLLELAEVVAASSSLNRVKNEIKVGEALIRYIRVLNTDHTLTYDEELAICQHMVNIGNLYDFPASPTITSGQEFNFSSNIIIQGPQGPAGQDGGGTDYHGIGLINNSVVDEFAITSADGAEWTYRIKDGTNLRVGRIGAVWLQDGSDVKTYHFSTVSIGNTTPIELSVVYFSGNIRLFATIVSGTWSVEGTRYFIPNNGAGNGIVSTVLPNGTIFIGDATNNAVPQTVTGDITISNSGVAAITTGSVINTDINASAAIDLTKLQSLTASRAVVSSGAGVISVSSTTSTEVGYLSGVTSPIQTQLDSKIGSVTGAISTVVSTDLTPSRVVISDPSGKIAVSGVTSSELGFLSGLSGSAQTQLNGKVSKTGDTMTGILTVAGISLNTSNLVAASGIHLVLNGTGALFGQNGMEVGGTTGYGILPGGISTQNPAGSLWKVHIGQIGDWNMDANETKQYNIPAGIDGSKIRAIEVQIRDDQGSPNYYDFKNPGAILGGSYTRTGIFYSAFLGFIILSRETGGLFDTNFFDATSYNRGWVTILYEA